MRQTVFVSSECIKMRKCYNKSKDPNLKDSVKKTKTKNMIHQITTRSLTHFFGTCYCVVEEDFKMRSWTKWAVRKNYKSVGNVLSSTQCHLSTSNSSQYYTHQIDEINPITNIKQQVHLCKGKFLAVSETKKVVFWSTSGHKKRFDCSMFTV